MAIKLQANSGDAAYCLTASAQNSLDSETETLIAVAQPVANAFAIQERAVSENPGAGPDGAGYTGEGAAYTLEARPQVQAVAHALRGEGHDASEDGTGRGVPIVPVAGALLKDSFSGGAGGRPEGAAAGHFVPVPPAVAFDLRGREGGSMPEGPHHTANIRAGDGGSSRSYVAESWAVRRLMPVECERLQGFPDGYTSLSGAKKPQADGPRYKQLGNSWPVNVVDWLAERIAEVDTWE